MYPGIQISIRPLIKYCGLFLLTPGLVPALELTTVQNSTDTLAGEVVLLLAYEQLGIDLKIRKYPAERALRMANHGVSDGEVQRIDAIADTYTNLIRLSPPVNYLSATVFSGGIRFKPDGWDSLNSYRTGIIRGIKFAELHTQGKNIYPVSSYRALFRMIENGRLDIAVAPRINGLHFIYSSGNTEIIPLHPPLGRFPLYHYLHKRLKHLVTPVENTLQAMHRQGTIDRVHQTINQWLLARVRAGKNACPENRRCAGYYRRLFESGNTPEQ